MTDAAPAHQRRSRLRTTIAAGLVLLLGAGVGTLAAPAPEAEAAVITPITTIYDQVVNGDYVMVGNGVLQAGAAAVQGLTANDYHNGVAQTGLANDNFTMQRRNAVPALVTAGADNSSSATLTVPEGARVARAFLFWQGTTGTSGIAGPNGTVVTAQRCTAGTGAATLPAGTPQNRQVMLQVGSGAVSRITGSITVEPTPTVASAQFYSGQADVTQQLTGIAAGTAQTINVGNLWVPEGRNCHGGWSLAVVYDFGQFIPGNTASQARQVILSSGHVRIQPNEAQTTTYSGFTSQAGDISAAFFIGEGDRNIVGDYGQYRAGTTGAFTRIAGATNETSNIGTGVAAGSVRYQGTGTGQFHNGNVDVRDTTLAGIPVGSTAIQLELGTLTDTYMLQASALAVPVASVRIEKTFTGAAGTAVDTQSLLPGQSPTFTITVTNTGSTPASNVAVADALAPACARTIGTLAVAAVTQYTCTGPATSAGYTNTASVSALGGGTNLTGSDTSVVQVGSIALTKTVTPAAGYTGRAGDTLGYTFSIRNSGTSALTSVTLADPMPGLQGLAIDWATSSNAATPAGTLAAGETVVGRASYTLTQANVDAGGVTNPNASVSGLDPDGDRIAATSSARQTVAAAPALALSKSGALAPGSTGRAGDTVAYVLSATNTGNVTLANITIADPHTGLTPLVYRWPGTPNVLLPGQTVLATASAPLTQAEVNAGGVDNTATVAGTPPNGPAVTTTSIVRVPVAPTPAIAVDKSGTVAGTGAAGDRIAYTFDLTNTGNVTLTGVALTDPNATGITPPAGWTGTMQPGQTARFTASHLITQAEVDAGSFLNTATVRGTPPAGPAVSGTDTFVAPLANAPGIDIEKIGLYEPNGAGNADDDILYTFTLTNSGRSTLTNVALADPALAGIPLAYRWPGTPGTLLPGQVATVTARFPVSQTQIDAGQVVNTATASATGPGGASVTDADSQTIAIVAAPALTLEKTATAPTGTPQADTAVPYRFVLANTGNVTLTGVALDDPMFEQQALAYEWPGAPGVLAPGQSVVVTASHPLTQAELDAGTLTNTATATGTSPAGTAPAGTVLTATDAVTIALPQTTAIDLQKTPTLADGDLGLVGDTVEYDLVLTNTGSTTLTDVTLDDPMEGLTEPTVVDWPGDMGVLLPQQSVTFTASYVITQADLDAQGVRNTATATAAGPAGVEATDVAAAEVPLVPEPAIAIEKDVTVPVGAAAGDAIAYDFVVTNTGTATLTGVGIADPLLPGGAIVFGDWPDPARPGVLAPTGSVEATATYALTQADVDAGRVLNTATATGISAQGVAASATDDAVATIAQPQSLTIDKTATLRGDGRAGSAVDYVLTVRNTGETTLSGVQVVDELPDLGAIAIAWPDPQRPGVLAPGGVATGTATYTVTQADVDAGSVGNSATATATGPAGPVASAPDVATVELDQTASLTLMKMADAPRRLVGDTVTYTFVAQNTGRVTLSGVEIDDPIPGLTDLVYDWSGAQAEGVLAPGQTVTATATLQITQAQVDAGEIVNTATVEGTTPAGGTATAAASDDVAIEAVAGVRIQKVGVAERGAASVAGDEVVYTFTVRSSGTLTITDVVIDDPLEGLTPPVVDWASSSDPATPAGVLSPGETVRATATYVLTQADVDAGRVDNEATVTATGADGSSVADVTDYTVALAGTAAIELDKSHLGTPTAVGETVTYVFDVANTGTVTLDDVAIDDPLPGLSAIAFDWAGSSDPATGPDVLSPGETVRATATLVITQANLDLGSIANTATASGSTPGGTEVDTDSDETTFVQAAQIELDKTTVSMGDAAGERAQYAFSVTNTGNVTLTPFLIVDELDGVDETIVFDWAGSTDPATGPNVLSPGENVVAAGSYVLTVADIDAGTITNEAVVASSPPLGAPVSDDDTVTDAIAQAPAIALDKSTTAVQPAAGDEIAYDLVATNTGTVTLSDVTIDDPMVGLSAPTVDWDASSDATTGEGILAPGETVPATATYTVTQDDVDRGGIDNTATARGVGAGGGVATATDAARVDIATTSSFAFSKDVVAVSGDGLAGDTITYGFTVESTGTTRVTGVSVVDPLPGLSEIAFAWPGAPGVLEPGAGPLTGTATYVITQADVDAGLVANTATASASSPGGPLPPTTDTVTQPLAGAALITLEKTGVAANGPASVAGDAIAWTFEVANAGTLTLTNPVVSDALPGVGTPVVDWATSTDPATPEGILAPGETVQATATSTISQADVDRGQVQNDASVTATAPAPGGGIVEASADAQATVPFAGSALLELVKTHDEPGSRLVVGSTVAYRFEVENAGTVTIDDVALADDRDDVEGLALDWAASSDAATGSGVLSPGETVPASATLTVTQALVDAGRIDNVATATGTAPDGVAQTAVDDDVVLLPQIPSIQLIKTQELTGTDADGTIAYGFTATNDGNVTLTGVQIADALSGLGAIDVDWAGSSDPATGEGVLSPGERVTASATYALTQADVDAGSVANEATATGTAPTGLEVTDPASVMTTIAALPGISLEKTTTAVDPDAGDRIAFDFRVVNTGNVTLSAVGIVDDLAGLSEIDYGRPAEGIVLAPGEELLATATYVVTQADVDAGTLVNDATAQGTPPVGAAVADEDDATVAFDTVVSLTLDKSTTAVDPPVGSTIAYDLDLVNDGDVTLTGVTVTDPMEGLSPLVVDWAASSDPSTPEGTLSPGETVSATATYVVTQADVDAAGVQNEATATGTPLVGAAVTTVDDVDVAIDADSAIAVEKGGVAEAGAASVAGDEVAYAFAVENTGSTTLRSIALSDALPGVSVPAIDWATSSDPLTPADVLSPGETVQATATYTLTQADVDAGGVLNEVDVTALAPDDGVVDAVDAFPIALDGAGALLVDKVHTTEPRAIGDEVAYRIVATNVGTVTLDDVAIVDDRDGLSPLTVAWPDPAFPGRLLPGQSATATATLVVTQADVDAGGIVNVATATGVEPDGDAVPEATDGDRVDLPSLPALVLEKSGTVTTPSADGAIDFGFVLTNDGNLTLDGVALLDELDGLGAITIDWAASTDASTPAGVLAPGEQVSASATYDLTQADVERGSVTNAATATGSTPADSTVEGAASVVVPIAGQPALTLVKESDVDDPSIGDTVTYALTATNSGNVRLTGVAIADPMPGLSEPTYAWPDPAAPGVLEVGESVEATATYVVTAADADRGEIANTATATGSGRGGDASATDGDVVELVPAPSIALAKTGALSGPGVVGDTVTYTLVATNDGDVTLGGVTIADPLAGLTPVVVDWAASSDPATGEGVLAQGETVTATASYVLTQADVDAGSVDNTATVAATGPGGPLEPADASESTPTVGAALIQLEKSATAEGGPASAVGDEIAYAFAISNAGTLTLTGVELDDPLEGLSTPVIDWTTSTDPTTAADVLAPGETVTATATYAITQADLDAGFVANTATASATAPDGTTTTTDDDATEVPFEGTAALSIDKSHVGAPTAIGDSVPYVFVIENVGTVTVDDVDVVDELDGLSEPVVDWTTSTDPATGEGILSPDERVTATAAYTIAQADVDAGSIVNTATVTGAAPDGTATLPAEDGDVVLLPAQPLLVLEKSGTVTEPTAAGAIDFRLVLTNGGTVTLDDVALADELEGLGPVAIDWAGSDDPTTGEGVLAPGERVVATATYALTQADVERGSVTNDALATATTPGGAPVEAADAVLVPIEGLPALTLQKSSDRDDPTIGDTVTYAFTAANTGNVRLTGVTIADRMVGLSALTYAWPDPSAPGVLEVGEEVVATATYVVTPQDADRGEIVNVATATGTGRGGQASAETSDLIELVPSPSLTLAKAGALDGAGVVGDTVSYELVATNDGDVTLTDVTITDPLDGLSPVVVDWAASSDPATGAGVLSQAETVTATASYVLTQADVDAGSVDNTATATATGPDGALAPVDASESTGTVGTALIQLEKSGTAEGGPASGAGDDVVYTFTIANAGTLTLSDVELDDPLDGLSTPVIDWGSSTDGDTGEGVLSPGETVTATATYAITQADLDAGAVQNTATVTALAPDGETTTDDEDSTEVPFEGTASLSIDKTHEGAPGAVGDEVAYAFVVENVGTVTVDEVAVVDELTGLSAPAVDWATSTDPTTGEGILSPGEQVTATASYTVTQADLDAGRVVNSATATGSAPDGGDVVSPEDGDVVPLLQSASITLTKEATADGEVAGSTIDYTFTVVNDGTVTVRDVAIADELDGLGAIAYDWAGSTDPDTGDGVLSPGETVVATAEYTMTQADVDAGGVRNVASASGGAGCDDDDTSTRCVEVSDASGVVTSVSPVAQLTLTKGADRTVVVAGDTITYLLSAENTGTATLVDVRIADELDGLSALTVRWPGEPGVLAPGERATATATYVVTAADASAGSVRNVATATATPPGAGAQLSATDDATVAVAASGAALPPTGASAPVILGAFALLLLLTGAVLAVRGRRAA